MYNKILLSLNNYLFIIEYIYLVLSSSEGHKFMYGPQNVKIVSLK
jgi:hypothetical protein